MASPNFSLPYPPVLNAQDTLQTFKVLVPVGFLTVQPVYTVAQGTTGKFFVTSVIFHDPSPLAGTCASVVLSIGSASTSTTSIAPQFQLTGLSGSVANQYMQYSPCLAGYVAQTGVGGAAVATTQQAPSGFTSAQALGPGDVLQVFVGSTAGTTNATILMDVVGYYL